MNSSSLDDFLTQATCAVLRDGQVVGTAWLFTSEGHLFTAGHVLDTESPSAEVQVQFGDEQQQTAKVIHWVFEEESKMDFAILQVVNRVGKRRPLRVSLARFIEGRCRLYGYGQSLRGLTSGVADYVGSFGSESNRLFRLDSKTLADEGFSGGALFSEELKAVVAIQTEAGRARLGPTKDTIFGLPLYRIAEYWPSVRELIGQRIEHGRDPYVGLQTFQEEDADVFYGREQLVQKVAKSPFLAVLGPSGSGKSSVVRAGLVPALKKGALPHSSQWHYLTIKPTERPLDALAAALNKLQGGKLGQLAELRQMLGENERALLLAADMARADNTETRLVLVVDQFEELWTLAPTEPDTRADPSGACPEARGVRARFVAEKQKPFIRLLLSAIQEQNNAAAPSLLIILTMRADFLHRAAENRELANAIAEADVIVSPMQPDELRRAISEPLKTVDGVFESGLVDELITQTSEREGALPLLQYTLAELWQAAEPNLYGTPTITWDAFRALKGVEGALAQRADTILQQEYNSEEQQQLRHLLVRLVQPGEGAADTRRRIPLAELVPADSDMQQVQQLLDPLVKNRLLTTGADPTTGQQTVEVSHEALIRAWPTLSEWIEDAREDLRFHLQLEEAAKEWQIHNQNTDFLWSGLRLANAQEWLERTKPQLNERDQRFLDASREAEAALIAREEAAQREREQILEAQAVAERRSASRLRIFLAVGSVLLVVAIILGGLAFNGQQQATNAEEMAVAEAKRAELAATQEAIARQDAEKQTNRAELAATQEAIARQDAESAATQEAIARQDAESAATQEAIARQEAQEAAKLAQSQALAASARSVSHDDPMQALLLAIEAGRLAENPFTVEALHQQLPLMPLPPFEVRHVGLVWGVKWNTEESRLLTWSNDGTAKIWNAANGELLFSLEHEDSVLGAQWNSDESRLLTWSSDDTAKVWDAENGQLLFFLEHEDSVLGAQWNNDESSLLTWSRDDTAKVWNAENGKLLFSLEHEDSVSGVQWNGDESSLLTWSNNGTAKVWDAENEQLLFSLEHEDLVSGAQWNSDESRLLTWSRDGSAKVWKAENGQLLFSLQHEHWVSGAQWNSDGSQLLTWSRDNTVKVWEAAKGQLLFSLEHKLSVLGARWNSDESYLLTWGLDGTAKIWEAAKGQLLFSLQHRGNVRGAQWNSDESRLLTWGYDGTAKVWGAEKGQLLFSFEHKGDVKEAQWNNDESKLLTRGSHVKVWEAEKAPLLSSLEHGEEGRIRVKLINDEKRLLTWTYLDSAEGTVNVWDTENRQLLFSLEHESPVNGVQSNADESRLLTWSQDGMAKVWQAEKGQLLFSLEHQDSVWGAQWNSDESRLLTWTHDGTAKVWQAEKGNLLFSLEHEGYVKKAQWNSDESRLLTWGIDKTAKVWEAEKGQLLFSLEHQDSVNGAQWNSDESRLLTWSEDDTAKVWNARNGQLLFSLEHERWVDGAQWNSDESRLLTWSDDETAKVWEAEKGQLLFSLEHESRVNGAQWNSDESRLLTWDGDTTKVWEAEKGQLLFSLESPSLHQEPQFNTTESRLLTWGGGTAKIWDAKNGQLLFSLKDKGPIGRPQWNFDESRLLTWSGGTAKVWDAKTGNLLFTLAGDGTFIQESHWNVDESEIMLVTGSGKVFFYYKLDQLLKEGCKRATRNLSWSEWQSYLPSERSYHKTCEHLPSDQRAIGVLKEEGESLAKKGDVDGAIAKFQEALELEPSLDIEPELEARQLAAQARVEEGQDLAKLGNIEGAMVKFQEALKLDPSLDFDPNTEARRLSAQARVEEAQGVAKAGDFENAVMKFQEALQLDPSLDFDPELEAAQLAVPYLLTEGDTLAEAGDLENAVIKFQKALQLDPSLDFDPELEARRLAAAQLLREGSILAEAGDVENAVVKFQKALQLDPSLDFDPEPEARRLAAAELVRQGKFFVGSVDLENVVAKFQKALQLDPSLGFDPELEARRLAAAQLVGEGKRLALARERNIEGAMVKFQEALELDPSLELDPETEAHKLVAEELLISGVILAKQGKIEEAIAAYSEAETILEPISAYSEAETILEPISAVISDNKWSTLCWFGSQSGYATDVIDACEQAVELAPNNAAFRDSRGLAQAVTGNYAEAIRDFKFFVEWSRENDLYEEYGRKREAWIAELEAGRNPFGAETLETLRNDYKFAADELTKNGRELAEQGEIEKAMAAYSEAQTILESVSFIIPSESWNILCWFGSLSGYAADVMDACERAVELAPTWGRGGIRDSRGLARALTGDYAGAIEDFEFFVEWSKENGHYEQYGQKREAWIAELEAGGNPFDAETLKELRYE